MARRLHQTMADYVVIAVSPALIMTLVGSLVFFLLAVLYQGEFALRLNWVMACFVFAAVLISRISIEEGFERAAPFGIVLAIVVGIAATKFMEVHGTWIDHFGWAINWGLIALIWWCAHRLTWDCTLMDDSQDASGEGLLQTAGLERPAEADQQADVANQRLEGTTSRGVPTGWWQRYVERQRRPHAPGVWVVYFSLAALPLFGIGQWFIPAGNVVGRRYAFWLLCVYVASGMGLLLTTSFLGLRRYLRQRRIEMPTLMANLWLGTGAAVIGLLLVLAALLPRPSAEYAISELPFSVGSPSQRASRSAPVPREGTRDQQPGSAPDRQPSDEQQDAESKGQNPAIPARGSGSQGQQQSPQPSAGQSSQGKSNAGDSQPSKPSASQQGSQPSSQGGGKGDRGDSKKSSAQDTRDAKKQADAPRDAAPQGQPPQSDENKPTPNYPPEIAKALEKIKQDGATQKSDAPPPSKNQPEQPASAPEMPQVPEVVDSVAGGLAELLKWIFYGAFALAVAYLLWRSRAEVLSAIREFLAGLRAFFSGLLGRKPRHKTAADAESPLEFPPAAFSTFADPFATGIAGRYSTEELVRYSFEAFEAWAREHGCARQPDQTPHELARDVSKLNAFIAADARNIAELYGRAAYSQGELPQTSTEQLRQLWQRMRSSMATRF